MRRLNPNGLVRPAYQAMDLYAPNRKPCAIDLSDNTNLVGVPPAARAAAESAPSDVFTRYPSLYAADLKRALGAYLDVSPEHIVTGCGSDDILDSAIRAMSDPGDAIAFSDPTFQMLPSFATMNGLVARMVPLLLPKDGAAAGFDIDAEGLLATGARIIYVCSPNNPTGTLASLGSIETLLSRAPGVVILDEAYVEYGGPTSSGTPRTPSLAKRAASEERLLVVRTLSKAFGLAGMRVGYAIGSRLLVDAVEKSRGPYKVVSLAERMATAALDQDVAWMKARVAEVLESRAKFEAFLRGIGRSHLPSSANFVLVPIDRADERGAALREAGIAVRPFLGLAGLGDALRISVGPWPLMEQTLARFEEHLR